MVVRLIVLIYFFFFLSHCLLMILSSIYNLSRLICIYGKLSLIARLISVYSVFPFYSNSSLVSLSMLYQRFSVEVVFILKFFHQCNHHFFLEFYLNSPGLHLRVCLLLGYIFQNKFDVFSINLFINKRKVKKNQKQNKTKHIIK